MCPHRLRASAISRASPARRSPPTCFVSLRRSAVACIHSPNRHAGLLHQKILLVQRKGGCLLLLFRIVGPGGGTAHESSGRCSIGHGFTDQISSRPIQQRQARRELGSSRGAPSGPARGGVANSALTGQFPAGQRQSFIDGLGNDTWFGVRLLGCSRSVLVVVGHAVLLQFLPDSARTEALSFAEVRQEEVAVRSL